MRPRMLTSRFGPQAVVLALAALSLVSVQVPPAAVADEKAAPPRAEADARPAAAQPKADAARPPELKPLDRWVGQWDLEVTTKGQWFPAEVKSKFVSVGTWDLNGRFLRCEAKGKSTRGDVKVDDAFLWLATYEPPRGEYRSWVFWSNAGSDDAPAGMWGSAPVSSGQWDEAAKTLTLRSEDKEAGVTSHGLTRWLDNDRHEFTTTIKDAAGQVMMEQRGKATRRK